MGSLGPRPPQGVGGGVFISKEPNDIGYYSGLDMLQNCSALDTLWTDSADDTHGTLATVLSLPCYCWRRQSSVEQQPLPKLDDMSS